MFFRVTTEKHIFRFSIQLSVHNTIISQDRDAMFESYSVVNMKIFKWFHDEIITQVKL
jgi:hypothetical protein